MTAFEGIRRSIRLLLAVLLWSHALFLLNLQASFVPALGRLVRASALEVTMFALLLVLSFLTSSGFWRTVGNLAYIYFFPFVLLFYLMFALGKGLVSVARWFNPRPKSETLEMTPQATISLESAQPNASDDTGKSKARHLALILSRPVRRFTLLWCLLLLVTTHSTVLWLSLSVVLLHLGRAIFRALRFTLFSGPWFEKVGQGIREATENTLEKLAMVTDESPPSKELENLWNQIKLFEKGVRFLENKAVVSKWTWFLCGVVLATVYIYLAVIFSFAYYGIA